MSRNDDPDLIALAAQLGEALRARGWRLVTAESCTAGWIAKAVTDIPGSSGWFDSGYVTYSNGAKVRDLGVRQASLDAHGAVSDVVVAEMAEGAMRRSGVEVAVATSGIAGPDGGVAGKPVGTVWFAVSVSREGRFETNTYVEYFDGDREAVRRASVRLALELTQRAVLIQ